MKKLLLILMIGGLACAPLEAGIFKDIKKGFEKGFDKVKDVAEDLAKSVKKGADRIKEQAETIIKKALECTAFAALQTASLAQTAAVGAIAGTLKGFEKLAELGSNLIAKGVNIKSVGASFSIDDAKQGKTPSFTLIGVFFTKEVTIDNFQLDLLGNVKKLLSTVLDKIK